MKSVTKSLIVIFAIICIAITFNYNLHTIKFNGIKLKLPFIVNKSSSNNSLTVTKIPPDGTLLIITGSKGLNFNEYYDNILSKVKSETVIENKILRLKDGERIPIVISRLTNSPQATVVHGYIEKKRLVFTLYGTSESIKPFYLAFKTIGYY